MRYIQARFKGGNNTELLIAKVSICKINGIEEGDKEITVFFEEEDFPAQYCEELAKEFNLKFDYSVIEAINWNAEWEKNFYPLIIGGFCSIRADFHSKPEDVLFDIVITPKMSFGTGHHATTALMITMMKEMNFKQKTVFDFGTGTGILAILAQKLGAINVEAVDNDQWSIDNAFENFQRNECSFIDLHLSSIDQSHLSSFDIILANINRNVLLENMEKMSSVLSQKGFLLLSGILIEDEETITGSAKKHGLKRIESKSDKGWMSVLYQKVE